MAVTEEEFVQIKNRFKEWARDGIGDEKFWTKMRNTWRKLYPEHQVAELERVVAVAKGKHLRVVK